MADTNFCWKQNGGGQSCYGYDQNGDQKSNAKCCRFGTYRGKGSNKIAGDCQDLYKQASEQDKTRLDKFNNHVCITDDSLDILTKSKPREQNDKIEIENKDQMECPKGYEKVQDFGSMGESDQRFYCKKYSGKCPSYLGLLDGYQCNHLCSASNAKRKRGDYLGCEEENRSICSFGFEELVDDDRGGYFRRKCTRRYGENQQLADINEQKSHAQTKQKPKKHVEVPKNQQFCWKQSGGNGRCFGLDKDGTPKDGTCCRLDGWKGKGDYRSGLCKDLFESAASDDKARLQSVQSHMCISDDSFEFLTQAPNKTIKVPDNQRFCWKQSGGNGKCNGVDKDGKFKNGTCCRLNGWKGKGDRRSGPCKDLFENATAEDKIRLQSAPYHMCIADNSLEFLTENKTLKKKASLPEGMVLMENDNKTGNFVIDLSKKPSMPQNGIEYEPGCPEHFQDQTFSDLLNYHEGKPSIDTRRLRKCSVDIYRDYGDLVKNKKPLDPEERKKEFKRDCSTACSTNGMDLSNNDDANVFVIPTGHSHLKIDGKYQVKGVCMCEQYEEVQPHKITTYL